MARKTSLGSSQEHAVLAHQPCSTPSWLWDSLQTSQGTVWLGVPGGGTCYTPMQQVTGSALQCPVLRAGSTERRKGKHLFWEPAGITVLLAFIHAAPAVGLLPHIAPMAQEVCKVCNDTQALLRKHLAQGRVF